MYHFRSEFAYNWQIYSIRQDALDGVRRCEEVFKSVALGLCFSLRA